MIRRCEMNMPRFTGEASLYKTSGHYQMTARLGANARVIHPQLCDVECALSCDFLCGDLPGPSRLQCLRQCFRTCGCTQVCGPCQYYAQTGWSQQCCRPDGTNCSRQICTPPEQCTVQDDRACLPPPFDSICWGSCTRTCCHWSGDQYVCAESPC
jgi:hypothetical protein